jgi:hypothetical protein
MIIIIICSKQTNNAARVAAAPAMQQRVNPTWSNISPGPRNESLRVEHVEVVEPAPVPRDAAKDVELAEHERRRVALARPRRVARRVRERPPHRGDGLERPVPVVVLNALGVRVQHVAAGGGGKVKK